MSVLARVCHLFTASAVEIAPGAHVRPSTNIGYLTGLLLKFSFI